MPQLVFADYLPQVFWLAITFFALYFALARFVLPKIGHVLEDRAAKISGDIEQAARLDKDAGKALSAYETALAEAKSHAHEIAAKNRDVMQSEIDSARAGAEAEVAALLEKADGEIRTATKAAMANVETIAGETAIAVVDKLLGKAPDAAAAASSVKAELGAG